MLTSATARPATFWSAQTSRLRTAISVCTKVFDRRYGLAAASMSRRSSSDALPRISDVIGDVNCVADYRSEDGSCWDLSPVHEAQVLIEQWRCL